MFLYFQGRTNLPPEKVPWDALVTLLSQSIYGGKIDNDFDQRLLVSFLSKLFTPRSFESDFALVANVDGVRKNKLLIINQNITSSMGTNYFYCLITIKVAGGPNGQRHITMPDGTRRDHFLKWIESLADRQTPSWLGLPNNAEKVRTLSFFFCFLSSPILLIFLGTINNSRYRLGIKITQNAAIRRR